MSTEDHLTQNWYAEGSQLLPEGTPESGAKKGGSCVFGGQTVNDHPRFPKLLTVTVPDRQRGPYMEAG